MTYDEIQKHKFAAFSMAKKQNKYIGALKSPKGPVIYVEIDQPIKGQLSFSNVNKYPGYSLIAYGIPKLIPGFNKINPTEWKSNQLKRNDETRSRLFETSYS